MLYRLTTRVCHSKCIVTRRDRRETPKTPCYVKDVKSNVMIPAFARIAHRKLRAKHAEIAARYNAEGRWLKEIRKGGELGIITSGISYQHCREAAPEASILKLALTYPLP